MADGAASVLSQRGKRRGGYATLAAALLLASSPRAAAALSKKDLLALAKRENASVVADLVKRECIDFDIDAAALVAFCGTVAPEILAAAIECRAAAHEPYVPSDGAVRVDRASPLDPRLSEPRAASSSEPPPSRAETPSMPVLPPRPADTDAWLRIASTSLKGGCFLFVDYGGAVARLRQRGTLTTQRLGSWEAEFRGEPYWWLAMRPGAGYSTVAAVPAGSHNLDLYCEGGWYRSRGRADFVAGRMHSLAITASAGGSIAIEGVRLEPADMPPPVSREVVHPRVAQ
jgi:hypothetical protein